MNLFDAIKKVGGGAANMTGLPYFIEADIVNPLRENAAILSKNNVALQNVRRDQNELLKPGQLLSNSLGALSIPFGLQAISGLVGKKAAPQALLQTGKRLGPNERYTLADFADYKTGRSVPHPKDLNPLLKDAFDIGKKHGIDVTSGSPYDIDMRVAEFLDRFGGL